MERSAIPQISFVTCWRIRKDKTTRWLPFWEYFKRWLGSHKQSFFQPLKLVMHDCWVLTLKFNVFVVKAPLLAYNSFVEAIFILNDCHAHIGYAYSQGSRVESQLFTIGLVCPTIFSMNKSATEILWGNYENSRSERMHICVSLLRQMAPEQSLMSLWSWLQNLQQIWLITCLNELKSSTCIQLRYLSLDFI